MDCTIRGCSAYSVGPLIGRKSLCDRSAICLIGRLRVIGFKRCGLTRQWIYEITAEKPMFYSFLSFPCHALPTPIITGI